MNFRPLNLLKNIKDKFTHKAKPVKKLDMTINKKPVLYTKPAKEVEGRFRKYFHFIRGKKEVKQASRGRVRTALTRRHFGSFSPLKRFRVNGGTIK